MPAGANIQSQTSPLSIKIDGQELAPREMAQLVDLTIEQDLVLPDVLSLRIRDISDRPGQQEQVHSKMLDEDRFPIGATIEIGLGREARPDRVLQGEITSLDLELRQDAPALLTVRAYDASYRLHRQRKSRTFLNRMVSDLAQEIAREYGLTPRVDPTSELIEHLFQDNQTDLELLRALADHVGFELFVRDNTLHFRKPAMSGPASELELGKMLRRLKLRLSTPTQVDEVLVRGWDPTAKREIVGRANQPSVRARVGEQRNGAQMSSRLGRGKYVLTEEPVRTQGEADARAQSLYDEIAGQFLQIEGLCLGSVALRPGQPVSLKNLGRRFDGEYYLSGVTHRVTPSEGFLTQVTVSGRRPNTLSALLRTGGTGTGTGARTSPGRYSSVVVGKVTNNLDPQMGGRVKVQFPWLAEHESTWARLATPMAGPGRGFYALPEVGDEVLVAFEHGDINYPYVIGALWNGRDAPPKPASDVVGPTGLVNQRIIRSRTGHVVTLDDSDDHPAVRIEDRSGHTIEFDSRGGKLTLAAKGDLVLKATDKVSVEAGGALDLVGSGVTTLKGSMVEINP